MYILLFILGCVGMSLKCLIHVNCSRRQYTSQFYSKWGFFKKSGRHQDRTTKTASRALVEESQTTDDIVATTAAHFGSKTDGATQSQVSQFDFAPESCPTYPGLLHNPRADCPQEAPSRQPRILSTSCLEERPQKSKASATGLDCHQEDTPSNPHGESAGANTPLSTNSDASGVDDRRAPPRVDCCYSDKVPFTVASNKHDGLETEHCLCVDTKPQRSPDSDGNNSTGKANMNECTQKEVGQHAWSGPSCNNSTIHIGTPLELAQPGQVFPTLCSPSHQTVDHSSALSQTLLSSPGSSFSDLSSMVSLKNRIIQNRLSFTGSQSTGSSSSSDSFLASISSSIQRDHFFQNKRRYHSYGSTKYWGPDDEEAQAVQDLSHQVWHLSLKGELYFAPMKNPRAILDLGTGTGIWVLDVADRHPEAKVEGNDVSLIQPTLVPPNSRFILEDFNSEWAAPNKYDFIHARELLGSVPDWISMYRKVYNALKPGGWFDQAEPCLLFRSDQSEIEDDHAYSLWNKVMIDAGKKAGMEFDVGPKIKDRLTDAGFVNVRVRSEKWPVGPWPKDPHLNNLGRFNLIRLCDGAHGLCSRRLIEQMDVCA
jgi:2-polyprenyl-3-methyl-5-hydroxy-6-metoxy-1,4-benzoquinol methylase